MTLLALTLVFFGVSCMFFCLWKSQTAAFKAMQEEHANTRRHIERLSVRCATLSAQLDDLVAASRPQQYNTSPHDENIDSLLQASQAELMQALPKFNL